MYRMFGEVISALNKFAVRAHEEGWLWYLIGGILVLVMWLVFF